MTRLPALDARRLEKALFALGFLAVRQRESHVFYRHPDGRTTTLPHHAGRGIARPLLREVLREIKVSPEHLADVLKRT